MNENIIGVIAGILTSIAMLPQLIKVIQTKKVEDLSLVMLLLGVSGLCLWLLYGFLKGDFPIILSNAVAFIVNVSLLICYRMYQKEPKKKEALTLKKNRVNSKLPPVKVIRQRHKKVIKF
ncbi:hypothetical protein D1631_00155 [Chryseobacterium nematophagum]|uniref:MtN3 and saliva related transmembrane protein n=1 Tax=Chryseobacterium nematophagum TaxID=2305228 RepID=A0A3M7TKY3_9FLAO|nr:SemiSWEET transporter [Chryseobacterium nematophagum]RNA63958.1 hypothetical protein D1631_00155 [Chryseobacterium nematophagum]